jgi:hypothetical protein
MNNDELKFNNTFEYLKQSIEKENIQQMQGNYLEFENKINVILEKETQRAISECQNIPKNEFEKCKNGKLTKIKGLIGNFYNISNLTKLSDNMCLDQCKRELKKNHN